MKRFISLFLCIFLVLGLTACGKASDSNTESTETTPSAETEAAETTAAAATEISVSDYQAPMSAVSMPTVEETLYAEDGTLLFTYTYQNIFPVMQDPDVANAVSLDLLNKIDASRSLAEDIKSAAQTDYSNSASWTPYFCSVYYNPMRIDQGVLSLFGNQISYQGSAHPTYVAVSASYDLVTGKALSISDILTEDYSAQQLSQLIVDALASLDVSLYSDYASVITDRFANGVGNVESWYLSQNGLCLYFSPYDIAPYSSGTVVAQIPYESLNGILKDDYFPAERGNYSGKDYCISFAEADLEQFSQYAEVILNRDGEASILYTDGQIFDVQLEIGSYTEESGTFLPVATVFACERLTNSDAVMIQKDSVLRLTYTSGGEKVTVILP